MTKHFVKKYDLQPNNLKETYFFEKKILIKTKGFLKLLNIGELSSPITIEVSYASKKAIEKVEKLGGSIKTTKTN